MLYLYVCIYAFKDIIHTPLIKFDLTLFPSLTKNDAEFPPKTSETMYNLEGIAVGLGGESVIFFLHVNTVAFLKVFMPLKNYKPQKHLIRFS